MPQIVDSLLDYGTPWALPDIYLFTGNPVRRSDGAIVMGRGAARQVRDSYPGLDKRIHTHRPVAFTLITDGQYVGWFQVKHHWKEPAQLDLIDISAQLLATIAEGKPHLRFHMNAPGIGNGRLRWSDVEPLLAPLPENVLIYRGPRA
jgi:hypothetical protein